MLRTNILIFAILVASFASAQITSGGAVVAAPGSTALISSVAIQSSDSALVQAAKRAVAARQRTLTVTIDNNRVRSSTRTLSTSSGGVVPTYTPPSTGERQQQAREQHYADPVAQQQNVQKLQNDLRQAAHEEDQGPYSDGQEDRSQQNLATIPGQLQQAQRPPQ